MRLWNEKRYHSLDYHLKELYGEKVYRISLNGGMTCPNRDGTLGSRGCIFCSAGGSGDFAENASLSITEQIEAGKEKLRQKTNCQKFIAYFQAYTNTYASVSYLRKIFTEAIEHPDIVILSVATRPDCINDEILQLLLELNQQKPVWIELGLQTIHPDTARFIRREFSLACYDQCVSRLTTLGLSVITHVILGLPGETTDMMLETVSYLAHSPISGIKLQLLHVLKDTDLAACYEAQPFPVFSLDDYCTLIAQCISLLPEDMVIHRITGDGPKNLLLVPLWSGNKKLVLNTIQKKLREENIWQGKHFS